MIQEIIVFILFASVIAYYLYRFFFRKDKKPRGGCEKCAEFKDHSSSKVESK